jgi:hypothetical protein
VDVAKAIRNAEELLPGVPAHEGQDSRWQAIIGVGEFIESEPEAAMSAAGMAFLGAPRS